MTAEDALPALCARCDHPEHDFAADPSCEVPDCACGHLRCPACRGSGVRPRVGDADPGPCPVCDGRGVAPRAADLLPEAAPTAPETRAPAGPVVPPAPEPVPDWVPPLEAVGIAQPGEAVTPPMAPEFDAVVARVLDRLREGPSVSVGLQFKLSQGPPDYQSAELSLHVSGLRAGMPEEEVTAALATGKVAYEAMKARIAEQAREVLAEWADGTWAR